MTEAFGRGDVAALIVTYNPDLDRLSQVLSALRGQVHRTLIVDNGSSNLSGVQALTGGADGVELVELGANRGIAAALNRGVDAIGVGSPWVLTLDQDTVVGPGALQQAAVALGSLAPEIQERCGLLALARARPEPRGARRRFVERALDLGDLGPVSRRRFVITSGNLVRREALDSTRYCERLFIDNVDTLFCADLRRAGWEVLELHATTMDHRLGATAVVRGRPKVFESLQRVYYVSRNESYLLVRGDLPLRVYLRDLVGLGRVHASVGGAAGALRYVVAVATGIFDAVFQRFGPRSYRLFSGTPG